MCVYIYRVCVCVCVYLYMCVCVCVCERDLGLGLELIKVDARCASRGLLQVAAVPQRENLRHAHVRDTTRRNTQDTRNTHGLLEGAAVPQSENRRRHVAHQTVSHG